MQSWHFFLGCTIQESHFWHLDLNLHLGPFQLIFGFSYSFTVGSEMNVLCSGCSIWCSWCCVTTAGCDADIAWYGAEKKRHFQQKIQHKLRHVFWFLIAALIAIPFSWVKKEASLEYTSTALKTSPITTLSVIQKLTKKSHAGLALHLFFWPLPFPSRHPDIQKCPRNAGSHEDTSSPWPWTT